MCQKREKASDEVEARALCRCVRQDTADNWEHKGHAPATLDHDRERCLCYLQYATLSMEFKIATAWMPLTECAQTQN